MKKLFLLSLLVSTPAFADYEDPYEMYMQPMVVREFADGVLGGALSKVDDVARAVGNAVRERMDQHGFAASAERYRRAARAHANVPRPTHFYTRSGGRLASNR